MKYAIISDIHANLPALQAVIRDLEAIGCDRVACLGDLVGYYRYPQECVELIRKWGIPCVKGNHDEYCSTGFSTEKLNPRAGEFVQWTRNQLSEENRQWLHNLPMMLTLDGFTIVHSTLEYPERWGYVFEKLAAANNFLHQTTQVCFFGHTHVPIAFVRDTMVRGGTYSKFKIERGKKYFINPGSAGQPRDAIPKPAYATYDLKTGEVELRRLTIDWDKGGLMPPEAGTPHRSC